MLPRKLLHISDLHASKQRRPDQEIVLSALNTDLLNLSSDIGCVDLVLFSGDIASRAENRSDYDVALDFVLEILNSSQVDETRLIMCPGNHDADQKFVNDNIKSLAAFRDHSRTREGLNQLNESQEFREFVRGSFDNFNQFTSVFPNNTRVNDDPFAQLNLFQNSRTAVIAINSAALSSGGLKEYADFKQLAIPEHPLREAIKMIPAGYARIVLGHHPLEWLNSQNHAIVAQIFGQNGIHYVHGHMHEQAPKFEMGLSGAMICIQGGALFKGLKENSYSLVNITDDVRFSKIELRSYFSKREEFAPAENLIGGGTFYSSEQAKEFWTSDDRRLTMKSWIHTTCLKYHENEASDTLASAPLLNVFVEPEFERDAPIEKGRPMKIGGEKLFVTYSDLIKSGGNFVISAPPEAGKTSVLQHLAMEECQNADAAGRVPVRFNFSETPGYEARYHAFIRTKVPELPEKLKIKDISESGQFLFLIDDIEFRETKKFKHLQDFINHFKKSRFIFTTSVSLLSGPGFQPKIGDEIDLIALRMRPLRMKQVRQLVRHHGITDPEANEKLISRMYDEMQALSVPLTPVNTTFLIQIFKSDNTATFVNRAKLIERFIETLLNRFALEDIVPGSFDFKNKTHVLAYVSEKMVTSGNFRPTEGVLLAWLGGYLDEMGFRYTARELLSYFLSARLFTQEGDNVEFKLKAFFSYFCALQMEFSPDFKEFILAEGRYLSFPEEIGFYAAIARNDFNLLTKLRERFERSFTLRRDDAKEDLELPIKVEKLRDLSFPERGSDADLYDIEELVFDRRLSEEERDAVLYGDGENDAPDQSVVKSGPKTESARSLSLLMMISAVLRHMDLVPNDTKREMLRGALDGWTEFTLLCLGMIPLLATRGEIKFDGIVYKVVFPEGMDQDELARVMYTGMPIGVGRLAFYNLGSEKLVNQLIEGIGDDEEPIERQLLRFFILADLGIDGIPALAQMLNKSIGGFRYLSNVLVAKLQETLLRLQYAEAVADDLREVTADLSVRLGTSTAVNRGIAKGRIIQKLKDHELSIRLKLGGNDDKEVSDDDVKL